MAPREGQAAINYYEKVEGFCGFLFSWEKISPKWPQKSFLSPAPASLLHTAAGGPVLRSPRSEDDVPAALMPQFSV